MTFKCRPIPKRMSQFARLVSTTRSDPRGGDRGYELANYLRGLWNRDGSDCNDFQIFDIFGF